jgi:hypothetical protein
VKSTAAAAVSAVRVHGLIHRLFVQGAADTMPPILSQLDQQKTASLKLGVLRGDEFLVGQLKWQFSVNVMVKKHS